MNIEDLNDDIYFQIGRRMDNKDINSLRGVSKKMKSITPSFRRGVNSNYNLFTIEDVIQSYDEKSLLQIPPEINEYIKLYLPDLIGIINNRSTYKYFYQNDNIIRITSGVEIRDFIKLEIYNASCRFSILIKLDHNRARIGDAVITFEDEYYKEERIMIYDEYVLSSIRTISIDKKQKIFIERIYSSAFRSATGGSERERTSGYLWTYDYRYPNYSRQSRSRPSPTTS